MYIPFCFSECSFELNVVKGINVGLFRISEGEYGNV